MGGGGGTMRGRWKCLKDVPGWVYSSYKYYIMGHYRGLRENWGCSKVYEGFCSTLLR
jgi:hypothetical protein